MNDEEMNFAHDKNYHHPPSHPAKDRGVEHYQEGIKLKYEDMEDHLYNNFGDRTEQQIEMKSDLEFLDSRAFENMVTDLENFNEKFAQMSIKQKTSYFIISTVLMSICHCMLHTDDQERKKENGKDD